MPLMEVTSLTWTQLTAIADAITNALSTTALLGIIGGMLGVTVLYTLIWRFSGYVRKTVLGAVSNSKRRR